VGCLHTLELDPAWILLPLQVYGPELWASRLSRRLTDQLIRRPSTERANPVRPELAKDTRPGSEEMVSRPPSRRVEMAARCS
jgi:hypothetical protein